MARPEFRDDPGEMTPEARLGELAAILAGAWLRHRRSEHAVAGSPASFTEKRLDCSGEPMAVCDEGISPTENAA